MTLTFRGRGFPLTSGCAVIVPAIVMATVGSWSPSPTGAGTAAATAKGGPGGVVVGSPATWGTAIPGTCCIGLIENGAAGTGAKVYGYELAGRNCGGVDGKVKKGTPAACTRHGKVFRLCDICHERRLGRILGPLAVTT